MISISENQQFALGIVLGQQNCYLMGKTEAMQDKTGVERQESGPIVGSARRRKMAT